MEDSIGDVVGESWGDEPGVQGLEPVSSVGSNKYSLTAATFKDAFTDYFSSPVQLGKSAGNIAMLTALINYLLYCDD